MRFTKQDQTGFIFCGAGLAISFLLAAYIDRWTADMLKDLGLAVFGWMFFALGNGLRRSDARPDSPMNDATRPPSKKG